MDCYPARGSAPPPPAAGSANNVSHAHTRPRGRVSALKDQLTLVVAGLLGMGMLLAYVTPAVAADISITNVANLPDDTTTVPGITTASGVTTGGTQVLITGTNLATLDSTGHVLTPPTVTFGANQASKVACTSASSCTATSPAGGAGVVDVQATLSGSTSAASAADQFTYLQPAAELYAWGVTAPKGGAAWLPGNLGGHYWSADEAQGLCRQDPVPNTKLHAINYAVCGSSQIGSVGQPVYDPRPNANGTHYVYVPDNASNSTAVWRLTFDPTTEQMVADPAGGALATAMVPLANAKSLRPNGMALGPEGNLYVTNLTELNIRKITNPNGDPHTQMVSVVAQTGDSRGANGTVGFIGNNLYISENRGTSFFDVTQCPMPNGAPCGTVKIPLAAPAAGLFIAGTAVDAAHRLVYSSNSPGGGNATIYRYDASSDHYVAFAAGSLGANPTSCPGCTVGSTPAPVFVTGGVLPASGSPEATVYCALTCQRPWDFGSHPTMGATTGFAFAFGLVTDPNGRLVITEDPLAGSRSARGTMWTVDFIP